MPTESSQQSSPRRSETKQLRLHAHAMALRQGGSVSRAQLRDLGLGRDVVRTEIRAGRWATVGRGAIKVAQGPLTRPAHWRIALANSAPCAALDGVTALEAAGLAGFTEPVIHLSVPPGGRAVVNPLVTLHHLRGMRPDQVIDAELRRVRPAIAAVRGAAWARSDRAAATILAMTVQQRLTTAADLVAASHHLPRNRRRLLIVQIAADIADGAHALSELDFAALCRRYGLPTPNRQALRQRPTGSAYLDVEWTQYRLVVEIDGDQHFQPEETVPDLLRHNDIALTGDTVLRIPVLGLRVAPEEFMGQVVRGLHRGGWSGAHIARV